MKKYLIVLFTLIGLSIHAQTDSSVLVLKKQLQELKTMRIRDSLKMDVLSQELQHLVLKDGSQANEQLKKIRAQEDSARIQNQLIEINRIKASTEGAAVLVGYDTLFKIYANLGPYNSLERAKIANTKIENLLKKTFYNTDSLKITTNNNVSTITYENDLITAINELDALWEGTTINELVNQRRELLNKGIEEYRKQNSFSSKVKSIGELLLIVIILIGAIYLLNRLFRRFKFFLINDSKWFKNGIIFKNYEVIKRSQLNVIIDKTLTIIKFILIFVLLFSTLPLALKIFPQTQHYAIEFKKIVFEPLNSLLESIINYLPNLVKIIFIVLVLRFVLRILKYFSNEIENENLKIHSFYPEWAKPTYFIIRFLLITFTLITIFPYLPGSGTIAFQGVSVFLGILISIGSSSAVANAIAGIVITYMRPFQQNDWIKTGSIVGIVIERSTLVTRLKTINNEDVTIPNSAILSGATINFSSLGKVDGLAITAIVKVKYSVNEDVVSKNLIKAANQTMGISKTRKPYVFQLSLNEINATYEINAITFDPQNMYYIKSDLIKNIHNVFKQANIPLNSVQLVSLEEIKKEP